MALLKPGGLAVHTFEFSLTHLAPRLAAGARHGETSLWTKADVLGLARDLCFLGYEVLPPRCVVQLSVQAALLLLGFEALRLKRGQSSSELYSLGGAAA